jgi:hypothetical protein
VAPVEESRHQANREGGSQEVADLLSPADVQRAVAKADLCMEELSAACARDPLDSEITTHTARCKPLLEATRMADYEEMDREGNWLEVGRAMFEVSFGLYRWKRQIQACRKLQEQAIDTQ